MNKFSKAIIVLAIIGIVGYAATSFAGWGRGGGNCYGQGSGWAQRGSGPAGYQGNLSDDQIDKLNNERQAFFEGTRELRENLYQKELELRSELAKKDPDAKKAVPGLWQGRSRNASRLRHGSGLRHGPRVPGPGRRLLELRRISDCGFRIVDWNKSNRIKLTIKIRNPEFPIRNRNTPLLQHSQKIRILTQNHPKSLGIYNDTILQYETAC
jgi:hypothetical protein